MDLITYINEKTNNSYADVKISNVVFNKQSQVATFKFIYKKERNTITEKERGDLQELVKEFLNLHLVVDVKTKKALIDEDVVKEFVFKFVTSSYTSIANGFSKNNIAVKMMGESIAITVSFNETYYSFVKNKGFENELIEFLDQNFFEKFQIEVKPLATDSPQNYLNEYIDKVSQNIYDVETKPQYANVKNVDVLIGAVVTERPVLVSAIKSPVVGVAVAGNLRFITKRSFTSKRKNEQGEFVQKDYFSFNLVNGKDSLPCVLFLSESDIEKFETMQENQTVVVFGDAEKFNEKLNFKVKRISICEMEEPEEEVVPQKGENENYIFVQPEPYIMLEQPNLFEMEEKKVNDFLSKNTVVVFDLETTGLEATTNEIIEIGAVKIENGKITETFSSLIKPKEEISEEITGITGITNEMVANAYSIDQVLPDFYKFTRGAVLSAYNIAFDYNFLYVASKKLGYNFNNKQIDAMYLARTKVTGIKNYKLKTVATALGVSLENAHRAVHDAIATAEVFILLSDDLK